MESQQSGKSVEAGREVIVPRTAAQLQKIKLEKLMKNPVILNEYRNANFYFYVKFKLKSRPCVL